MDAAVLARENALLKARLTEVEVALAESQEANRRLEDILRTSQREKFGKRSEKLSPDQFNLPLEDAELAQGVRTNLRQCGGAPTLVRCDVPAEYLVAHFFRVPEKRVDVPNPIKVGMSARFLFSDRP